MPARKITPNKPPLLGFNLRCPMPPQHPSFLMEKLISTRDAQNPSQSAEQQDPAPDWTESEWFQTWLRLARRDYHGRVKRGHETS